MIWTPYSLSGKQRKNADRVGGIELMLPWPDGLPLGPVLAEDEERDTTAAEHRAAEQIVGSSCRHHGLIPVRSLVAMLHRPKDLPGGGVVAQHLGVIIIGRKWVHATGRPRSVLAWAAIERVEQVEAKPLRRKLN